MCQVINSLEFRNITNDVNKFILISSGRSQFVRETFNGKLLIYSNKREYLTEHSANAFSKQYIMWNSNSQSRDTIDMYNNMSSEKYSSQTFSNNHNHKKKSTCIRYFQTNLFPLRKEYTCLNIPAAFHLIFVNIIPWRLIILMQKLRIIYLKQLFNKCYFKNILISEVEPTR